MDEPTGPGQVVNLPCFTIQLLESPIPVTTPATTTSQKASSGDISGTKRGIKDPLVSKRPEKIKIRKLKKKTSKMVKNGEKWPKWSKMVQDGEKLSKWSKIVKNGQNWYKMV